MGGRISKFNRKVYKKFPTRHGWTRIQDAQHVDYDSDKSEEYITDRRIIDEKLNWPKSCPVMHLDIENDFQLEAQKKFIKSVYRFWIFSFWSCVLNFVAIMASLLTSNVTNSSQMALAFVLAIVYLFATYFLYFRVIYWALRLESVVLYIWFYIYSVILWAFFGYYIGVAISLVSILAEPLAPGSQLPVKVNPIFPVIAFLIVIFFYIFCVVYVFYCFSKAFGWQQISDKEKMILYKKEQKSKYLSTWWGGKKRDDGSDDSMFDSEFGVTEKAYDCILYYDRRDLLNSPDQKVPDNDEDPTTSKNILAIPGKLLIFAEDRKICFQSNETYFNSLFKVQVMIIMVREITTEGKTELRIVENYHQNILKEDENGFYYDPGGCITKASTTRTLKMDFPNKPLRDEAKDIIKKLLVTVKKREKVFSIVDQASLKQYRIDVVRQSRERAEEHLITHKQWKSLCNFVWRKVYKAGEVIMEPGQRFHDILHVSSGTITIYLETTNNTVESEYGDDDDNGSNASHLLFPMLQAENRFDRPAPILGVSEMEKRRQANFPFLFSVKFQQRDLGFSYKRKKRQYNLSNFNEKLHQHGEVFPKPMNPEYAAIVQSVKPNSQAAKLGIQVNDELVKVGVYNVESFDLDQRSITNLIKNHVYPMILEFRRPPSCDYVTDEAGFISPNTAIGILPEDLVNGEGDEVLDGGGKDNAPNEYDDVDEDDELDNEMSETAPLMDYADASQPMRVAELSTKQKLAQTDRWKQKDYLTDSDDSSEDGLLSLDGGDRYGRASESGFSRVMSTISQPLMRRNKVQPELKSFEMARLDHAEDYAAKHQIAPTMRPKSKKRTVNKRLTDFNAEIIEDTVENVREKQLEAKKEQEAQTLIERGHKMFFGSAFDYKKVSENNIRKDVVNRFRHEDEISIVVEGDDEEDDVDSFDDDVSVGGSQGTEPDEELKRLVNNLPAYQSVGTFESGDTIGIVPWILNHPVSVVQLVADTDVTISSILVDDLLQLIRKDASLGLAFFKYAAAVIGERADRDEEHLCDQLIQRYRSNQHLSSTMTRLLDSRPIVSSRSTNFRKNCDRMSLISDWFNKDYDMEFDRFIMQARGTAFLTGGIDKIKIGGNWYSGESKAQSKFDEPKKGMLIITTYHVCFQTLKQTSDIRLFRRRPTFYGKIHLDDIYNVSRGGANGESLTIESDDCRLTVEFDEPAMAYMCEDWIQCLMHCGGIVETAPSSYTLNGDDEELRKIIGEDQESVFTRQRGFRAEFLILTKTLQQVLTKEDRLKLFQYGQSVTLRKGQNVFNAATFASDIDELNEDGDQFQDRRTSSSRKNYNADSPIGLYMLGFGELVVQREIDGKRIKFASYQKGAVFGIERFLTGAPSAFTVKVASEVAMLKFVPQEKCMALLRSDIGLAARFYQYSALVFMQRLRGAILSRPYNDVDLATMSVHGRGNKGCVIL